MIQMDFAAKMSYSSPAKLSFVGKRPKQLSCSFWVIWGWRLCLRGNLSFIVEPIILAGLSERSIYLEVRLDARLSLRLLEGIGIGNSAWFAKFRRVV